MKNTRLEQMKTKMSEKLGPEKGKTVASAMDEEYLLLCQKDPERPKDLLRHLHNNIFPVISAYRALMKEGTEQSEASELAQSSFLELMEGPAQAIRKLCKIPGFYKLMPGLFGKLMPKLFKKEAGFEFSYYPGDKNSIKFDMLKCPYYQVCQELDCKELAPVFCETDDICYGNMHPALKWKRTKTMARGGDLCDFYIEIENTKKS